VLASYFNEKSHYDARCGIGMQLVTFWDIPGDQRLAMRGLNNVNVTRPRRPAPRAADHCLAPVRFALAMIY
jgi:hypothetical protein